MPSLKKIGNTLAFTNSKNTLGIAKNSSTSFYAASIKTNKELTVHEVTIHPTLGPQLSTSLKAPGHGTMSPALVNFNNALYLFYRKKSTDLSGDIDLKFKKYTQGAWTNSVYPSGVKASSDHNPVVIVLGSEICMIDKNNTHHFIAEAWMDTSENWSTNNNTTYWVSDDAHKKDWGYQTQDSDQENKGKKQQKDQILTDKKGNPITPRNPSMAIFNNKIFAAYKGGRISEDSTPEKLYLMTANSKHQWTNPVQFLSGETSIFAPTITTSNNYLICVFARNGYNNQLHYSISSDGLTWSSPSLLISDQLDNGKATDPFIMDLGNNTIALSYATGAQAQLALFSFS